MPGLFKLLKMKKILTKTYAAIAIAATMFTLSSCNGFIYEAEGDCEPKYTVSFKYDRNIKFADAFSAEVDEVDLYLFDEADRLVLHSNMTVAQLRENGGRMPLDVTPGRYDIIVWARQFRDEATGFQTDGRGEVTRKDDLAVTLERKYLSSGEAYLDNDIHSLFHGELESVEFPDAEGSHHFTVSLTKDTNAVRVLLQKINGETLDPEMFSFYLLSDNGSISQKNRLREDEMIHYTEWSKVAGNVSDSENRGERGTISQVSAVLAELTVSRLEKERPVRLVVTRADRDEPIISIPFIDYALMVKGNYRKDMTDQEYLDRQDEYPLVFFLDSNYEWERSSGIYINSWHIVVNNEDLGQ